MTARNVLIIYTARVARKIKKRMKTINKMKHKRLKMGSVPILKGYCSDKGDGG